MFKPQSMRIIFTGTKGIIMNRSEFSIRQSKTERIMNERRLRLEDRKNKINNDNEILKNKLHTE